MHVARASFAWYIFNLNTGSYYLKIRHYSIYTPDNASFNPTSCSLLSPIYLLGELASLLVVRMPIDSCPWSANNCPTLCRFSYPFSPHRSSYNIYIDDINNTSCPRREQYCTWILHMAGKTKSKHAEFTLGSLVHECGAQCTVCGCSS